MAENPALTLEAAIPTGPAQNAPTDFFTAPAQCSVVASTAKNTAVLPDEAQPLSGGPGPAGHRGLRTGGSKAGMLFTLRRAYARDGCEDYPGRGAFYKKRAA